MAYGGKPVTRQEQQTRGISRFDSPRDKIISDMVGRRASQWYFSGDEAPLVISFPMPEDRNLWMDSNFEKSTYSLRFADGKNEIDRNVASGGTLEIVFARDPSVPGAVLASSTIRFEDTRGRPFFIFNDGFLEGNGTFSKIIDGNSHRYLEQHIPNIHNWEFHGFQINTPQAMEALRLPGVSRDRSLPVVLSGPVKGQAQPELSAYYGIAHRTVWHPSAKYMLEDKADRLLREIAGYFDLSRQSKFMEFYLPTVRIDDLANIFPVAEFIGEDLPGEIHTSALVLDGSGQPLPVPAFARSISEQVSKWYLGTDSRLIMSFPLSLHGTVKKGTRNETGATWLRDPAVLLKKTGVLELIFYRDTDATDGGFFTVATIQGQDIQGNPYFAFHDGFLVMRQETTEGITAWTQVFGFSWQDRRDLENFRIPNLNRRL